MFSISYQIVTLSLLLGFLALAAAIDIRSHRVPNPLVLLMLFVGALLYAMQGQVEEFGYGCLGLIAGFVMFIPLYLTKGMGAGDVKLMAACGFYLGPEMTFFGAAASLMVGGSIAAAYWLTAIAGNLIPRFGAVVAIAPADALKKRLPFASSIAVGVSIVAFTIHNPSMAGLLH